MYQQEIAAFDCSQNSDSYPSWRGSWRTCFYAYCYLLTCTWRHLNSTYLYTFVLLCTIFMYCLGLVLPVFCWGGQEGLWASEHHTALCFGNCLAGKNFSHADHILQGPHVSHVTHFEPRSPWYLYGITF